MIGAGGRRPDDDTTPGSLHPVGPPPQFRHVEIRQGGRARLGGADWCVRRFCVRHFDSVNRAAGGGNPATGLRYNVEMTVSSTDIRPTYRPCTWCSTIFAVSYRPGRPRIYCSKSCRQRAYERRRGLAVLPPPDRLIMVATGPLVQLPNRFPGYERGEVWSLAGKAHAMRPAGISEAGERRLTLCGALARPVPRSFHGKAANSCATCVSVERVRPSARAVRPSADLAALRFLLGRAAVEVSRSRHGAPKTAEEVLLELLAAA